MTGERPHVEDVAGDLPWATIAAAMGTLPALPPASRGVSAFVGVGHREVRYRADGGHLPTARR